MLRMVLSWSGQLPQERPTTERQSYLPELIIRMRIIDKLLDIIRSYICLPNTLGQCVLQVMNRNRDAIFLILTLIFTALAL